MIELTWGFVKSIYDICNAKNNNNNLTRQQRRDRVAEFFADMSKSIQNMHDFFAKDQVPTEAGNELKTYMENYARIVQQIYNMKNASDIDSMRNFFEELVLLVNKAEVADSHIILSGSLGPERKKALLDALNRTSGRFSGISRSISAIALE